MSRKIIVLIVFIASIVFAAKTWAGFASSFYSGPGYADQSSSVVSAIELKIMEFTILL